MLESSDGIARDPAFKRKRRDFKWPEGWRPEGKRKKTRRRQEKRKGTPREDRRGEERRGCRAKIPRVGRAEILMEMAGDRALANGSRETWRLAYPV